MGFQEVKTTTAVMHDVAQGTAQQGDGDLIAAG